MCDNKSSDGEQVSDIFLILTETALNDISLESKGFHGSISIVKRFRASLDSMLILVLLNLGGRGCVVFSIEPTCDFGTSLLCMRRASALLCY